MTCSQLESLSLLVAACFLVSVLYFVSQGWIEIAFLRKLYKTVSPNKIDDSRKTESPQALKRAEAEERRRDKARRFRRTLNAMSHHHHDWDLSRGSRGSDSRRGYGAHSANTSYNSHQNPLLMADYFSRDGDGGGDEDSSAPHPRFKSSPEVQMPRYNSPPGNGKNQARKSYTAPIVISQLPQHQQQQVDSERASQESRGSTVISGVSLGSSFLNPIPEAYPDDGSDHSQAALAKTNAGKN